MNIKEIEQKYIGQLVTYAGAQYECCGVVDLYGCTFLEIYDNTRKPMIELELISLINGATLKNEWTDNGWTKSSTRKPIFSMFM